jgi:hypothetical protein
LYSRTLPDVDETNIGNRDPLLRKTYKGLLKLRYARASDSTVYFIVHALLVYLILFRGAYIKSWSDDPTILAKYSDFLTSLPQINKE